MRWNERGRDRTARLMAGKLARISASAISSVGCNPMSSSLSSHSAPYQLIGPFHHNATLHCPDAGNMASGNGSPSDGQQWSPAPVHHDRFPAAQDVNSVDAPSLPRSLARSRVMAD
jgi:hypothetical protein